jgi:septal ring factor EnvC (AmiA/AmiB activator)
MRLAASERRADVMTEQMQSPYVSFFYADDEKRSFVLDEIHRRGIPFRETENGFEAQQCYTEEIRQVENKYRPQKSNREKLRDDIDRALMQSKDFDEFLVRIEKQRYEIKRGKYLALRPQFAANFIRVKSLGEFYSEDALRNRLSAKHDYEQKLLRELERARLTNAPNRRVLEIMHLYIVSFSKGYFPVCKKNPSGILTWKNDAQLDRLTALNEKINNGATLDSLRTDMEKKAQAVHEIERTIENSKITDPEVAAKLSIALQSTQQELKEASDWVTTAEQVIGGGYIVSGHSSGGVLAAYIAANDPNVKGLVLEDPPLFRVTPEEAQEGAGTFAWYDGYIVAHSFLQQSEVTAYPSW